MFKRFDEIDVVNDTVKVSLFNSITKSFKNEVPVQGAMCQHVICTDLKYLLAINQKSFLMACPDCKKQTNVLYLDSFYFAVFKYAKSLGNENLKEFEVFPNQKINFIDEDNNIIEKHLDDVKLFYI